ncbi:hypothetical protein D3C86_1739980 [compost metagenome]
MEFIDELLIEIVSVNHQIHSDFIQKVLRFFRHHFVEITFLKIKISNTSDKIDRSIFQWFNDWNDALFPFRIENDKNRQTCK